MDAKDIKINHWYLIKSYGHSTHIKGKAVAIVGNYYGIFKFYWGGIFRSCNSVELRNIVSECEKPSFFGNY
jgi:ATP sulfurylase